MSFKNLRLDPNRAWFDVKNETDASADIYVYDVIGEDWNGNGGAKDYLNRIKAVSGKHINLHINSPGGSVFDASAIVMALAAHKGGVTAHIDGLAASAASWLALAADKILMADTGMWMMHNASAYAWGEAKEMRKTADLLDAISGQIADSYKKRSKKKDEDIHNAMDSETWLTAEQAKQWGFVDEVVSGIKATNCATPEIAAAFGFKNAPTNIFKTEPETAPATTPAPASNHSPVKPASWYQRRTELNKRLANT